MRRDALHFVRFGPKEKPIGRSCPLQPPENVTSCIMKWMNTMRRRCGHCVKEVAKLDQEQAGA